MEAGTLSREDVDQAHREMEERERQEREAQLAADEQIAAEQGTGSDDLFAGDEYQDVELKLFEDFVGGKAPTTVKVRLLGGAVEVPLPEGGLKKGQNVVLRVEGVVRKVEFTDEIDNKTSQVTGCAKGHGIRITGASWAEVL